jgi:hypothetical protein
MITSYQTLLSDQVTEREKFSKKLIFFVLWMFASSRTRSLEIMAVYRQSKKRGAPVVSMAGSVSAITLPGYLVFRFSGIL